MSITSSYVFDCVSLFSDSSASKAVQVAGETSKNPFKAVDRAVDAMSGKTDTSGGSKPAPKRPPAPRVVETKPPMYFQFPKGDVNPTGHQMDYAGETALQVTPEDLTALGLTELVKFAQLVLGIESGMFFMGLAGHASYEDFINGLKGKDYKTSDGYTLPMNIKTDFFSFLVRDTADGSGYDFLDDLPLPGGGRFTEGGFMARCAVPLEPVGGPDNSQEGDGSQGEVPQEEDGSQPDSQEEVVSRLILSGEVLYDEGGIVVEDITDDDDDSSDDSSDSPDSSDGSSGDESSGDGTWASPYSGYVFPTAQSGTLLELVKSKGPNLLLVAFDKAVRELREHFKVTHN